MSRLRDPLIGKFISADPTIPNLYDLQSFNRYAYVRNNPLKFYDPSGYTTTALGDDNGSPDEASEYSSTKTTKNEVVAATPVQPSNAAPAVAPKDTQKVAQENKKIELNCSKSGCWETKQQKELRGKGDAVGWYESQCSGGNGYACNAARIAKNDVVEDYSKASVVELVLTKITNINLQRAIIVNQDLGNNREGPQKVMDEKMDSIRLGLMQKTGEYFSRGTPNNPVMPSRNDITNIHYQVFINNGIPSDTFGGSKVDNSYILKTVIQTGLGYNWCISCVK